MSLCPGRVHPGNDAGCWPEYHLCQADVQKWEKRQRSQSLSQSEDHSICLGHCASRDRPILRHFNHCIERRIDQIVPDMDRTGQGKASSRHQKRLAKDLAEGEESRSKRDLLVDSIVRAGCMAPKMEEGTRPSQWPSCRHIDVRGLQEYRRILGWISSGLWSSWWSIF